MNVSEKKVQVKKIKKKVFQFNLRSTLVLVKMHDILENLAILQLIANISDRHCISCLVILPIFDYGEAIYRQV